MKQKNLQLNGFEPQLALFFKDANALVFGKAPYVHPKRYAEFSALEAKLRKMEISSKDYAYAVVKILEKWTRSKGMECVPIKTFTGKWALTKYLKVHNSDTIEISLDEDEHERMLHSEMEVALQYIYQNRTGVKRMSQIVEEMRPLLYKPWLEAYYNNQSRPVVEVLDILCEKFGVANATSYADIVTWQTNTVTR